MQSKTTVTKNINRVKSVNSRQELIDTVSKEIKYTVGKKRNLPLIRISRLALMELPSGIKNGKYSAKSLFNSL